MFTEEQTFAGSAEGPPSRARDRWYSQWGRDVGAPGPAHDRLGHRVGTAGPGHAPPDLAERLRLLARTTGEALWDGDLVTGVWKWDGATEALFGYRSPRGRTRAWWEECIHPEDRTRVLAGLACTLDGPADTWENEYRFRRADGSYGNVLARGSWCATVPASR